MASVKLLAVGQEEVTNLLGAIESNSSKNNTQGFACCALRNISRTDDSEAPIYLFNSSGPLTLIKFNPVSLATALAKSVLPHPGGPNNNRLLKISRYGNSEHTQSEV